MTPNRFVVLGVAPARSPWFRELSQWANEASIPVDFLKCLSPEEVRARLASGQQFSALIADAGIPAIDRDLVAAAVHASCAVVVVEDSRVRRDWLSLGAAATLPAAFDQEQLLGVLRQHATHIPTPDRAVAPLRAPAAAIDSALVVAVTGPGGAGSSTAAIALAQGLAAAGARSGRRVVLADLCLRAEQAMLHDVGDIAPGVQELVEAHRAGSPPVDEVRALSFHVAERRYDLLLGLRRARFWSTLRPRAVEAAFTSLCGAYGVVVCDVDSDLEGEQEGGSLDVEERHALSRAGVSRADVVIAVGAASMKGLHSLAVVVETLYGVVPHATVLTVVNHAPRPPRARAEITTALHRLVAAAAPDRAVYGPVFLPERNIDLLLRDGARLPPTLVQPLCGAVSALVAPEARRRRAAPPPVRVRPGSIGTWAEPA